ncbi:hypothetical protein BMS3Abin17_00232 [archaeon BMS3Abin17]|nr:hypothetical protein BMS3Abin17_00232 [archaeon BMS3Abin17]HDZ60800.1 hypothetical protein [Candidatus Pacearchaeota archaeon]
MFLRRLFKMNLSDSLEKIKEFLLKRYKDNLAGILVFGTANTGEFIEGKSDIDTMIFLNKLDLQKETNFLIEKLKSIDFATQYFYTLEGIKGKYMKNRGRWSTYVTIVSKEGSKLLYTTPEFERTKKYLIENPKIKEEINEYIREKDDFELEGYFKEREGYSLMKALLAHIRRKLQIINYYKTGKINFNYRNCLKNINLEANGKLEKFYGIYEEKRDLTKEEIKDYYQIAKKLTEIIINYPK